MTARAIRVGVIGAGGMGCEHIANLSALGDVDVVVVADPAPGAEVAVRELCAARVVQDPLAVLDHDDIDALVIASPDDTHADLAIAAIERGLPTLCEKPLASNVVDAERVVAAEEAANRSLIQVGFMRQYDAVHLEVKRSLAEAGALQHIRCAHRNTNHAWERPLDLVFSQSLIHEIHTVRWLSGDEFESVVTQVVSRSRPVDHVVVLATTIGGITVTIEFVEATYGYDVEVEATGADGMVIGAQPVHPVVRRHGVGHVCIGDDWFGRFRDAYRAEVVDWVAGLRAGTVNGPTAHDGLAAQRVVDAAIRSAASGRRELV